MDFWKAIILGIVQGLTEFLPISSTAHLKIVPVLLWGEDPGSAFTAVIQCGTLLAVIVYFWRDIVHIVLALLVDFRQGKLGSTPDSRMGWLIVLGSIPIVVCGVVFKSRIEKELRSLYVIGTSLIVLALLLMAAELLARWRERRNAPLKELNDLSWRDAIGVGLAQAVALIPGSSRSGVTITGGLFLGMTRATAARFSFLLSLPAVFGAAVFELYHERRELLASTESAAQLLIATAVSAVVGYASIAFLLGFLKHHTTWIFIIYRLILGPILLVLVATGTLQDTTKEPAMTQPLANRLAEYACHLDYKALPDAVVHETKRRFIDSFATAIGAMDADAYSIARRCAERVQSTPGASLLGGGRSSAEWATFVNGLLIRYLDYNDTYLSLEPAHPSDNLAAVLSMGEVTEAGGRELITAAVLAYEVQCSLCDAASLRKHGWDHVTYGAISSCIAACKLLKLDPSRMVHAIGIAGVCNTALRQTRSGELSMWKGCAFANAARNGVFAAQLAAEGMTGPSPIFEGDLGFMKLLTGPFQLAPLGGGTQPFMITKTYIKFWPAEYHSQSAIDAALQMRSEVGDVRKITAIDIHTFDAAVDIIGKDPEKWRPKTRETADHSLPYCTAVALVDGEVTLAQFHPKRFTDPQLIELVSRVKVHRDAALSARYPHGGIPNRLTVKLADGRQIVREVDFPRGHAGNPMSDAEVEHKFLTLAEPRYGKEQAKRMLAACWDLEKVRTPTELVQLFARPSK